MHRAFREAGGEGKPVQAGYKVCWGTDDDAVHRHRAPVVGQHRAARRAGQVLPSPRHFEQASALVDRDMTRDSIAYGADVDRHVDAFRPYAEAGFDEVHIAQMGGREPRTSAEGFFAFYRDEVLPRLRELS